MRTIAQPLPSLDAAAIQRRYRGPHLELDTGVLDIAPLLIEFHKLMQSPHSARSDRRLHEIAMKISRIQRFYVPPDDAIWRLADATRAQLLALTAVGGTSGPRTPGVQKALDEFAQQWTQCLHAERPTGHWVIFSKSVPLKDRVTCSLMMETGLHLGVHQPEDGFSMAKSVAPSRPPAKLDYFEFDPRPVTLLADQHRLRIEISPRSEAQLQDDSSVLEDVLQQLHFAFETAVQCGQTLSQALRQFNEVARPEFRMQIRSALALASRDAPLHPQGEFSRKDRVWFDCSLLARWGTLDAQIRSEEGRDRLGYLRWRVVKTTDDQMARLRSILPCPIPDLRVSLVAGCAIQLCLEGAQSIEKDGPRFDFQIGAEHIVSRMTPMERTLLQAVLMALESKVPGLRTSLPKAPEGLQQVPTYVTLDSGDPIGCVDIWHPLSADAWPRKSGSPDEANEANEANRANQANEANEAKDRQAAFDIALAETLDAMRGVTFEATPDAAREASLETALKSFAADARPVPAPRRLRPTAPGPDPVADPVFDTVADPVSDSVFDPASAPPPLPVRRVRRASDSPTDGPRSFDELQPEATQPTWIPALMQGDDFEMMVGSTQGAPEPVFLLDEDIDSRFAMYYDMALDELLADLQTPRRYTDFSSEVAPRLIVDCPGWPVGRQLDIHNVLTGSLMLQTGLRVGGLPPVRIVRHAAGHHYMALQNGVLLSIPGAGDCFYLSVLAAMAPDERAELLDAAGCTGPQARNLDQAALALRQHLARHLSQHREHYRDQLVQLECLIG